MALELPEEVVSLLQFIGVNWPNVNEDKVREFAAHIRDFATKVDETHQDSTATIKKMADVYQGPSYDALLAKWGEMSNSHMSELLTACHAVATALDVAADVIVAMKEAAIAELVVLAASFVADQAAAVATLGLAEAAEALIVEAAEKAVDYLEQQLEQYIIGEVIEAAVNPLIEVVGRAASGLMFKSTESALGVTADAGGAGTGFSVHPEDLQTRAELMKAHASTVASHAEEFRVRAAGMSFE
ncbi:WXG100-like domain-containing protein [Streptomyces sp. NPDC004012]